MTDPGAPFFVESLEEHPALITLYARWASTDEPFMMPFDPASWREVTDPLVASMGVPRIQIELVGMKLRLDEDGALEQVEGYGSRVRQRELQERMAGTGQKQR